MSLEDGRFLVEAHRYQLLKPLQVDHESGTRSHVGPKKARLYQSACVSGFRSNACSTSRLAAVHPNFRVVALASPCPPFDGRALDPPLRSRFQSLPVLAVTVMIFSIVQTWIGSGELLLNSEIKQKLEAFDTFCSSRRVGIIFEGPTRCQCRKRRHGCRSNHGSLGPATSTCALSYTLHMAKFSGFQRLSCRDRPRSWSDSPSTTTRLFSPFQAAPCKDIVHGSQLSLMLCAF